MLNRWLGILSFFLMVSVNGALLLQDVVPNWFAGDPPLTDAIQLQPGQQRSSQVGIYDEAGRNLGHSWTLTHASGTLVTIRTWTILRAIELPNGLALPAIRIDSEFIYQQSVFVDTINIQVQIEGLERVPIQLQGEYVSPDAFAWKWKLADKEGSFVLNPEATRALGDLLRPFDRLPGLFVGRTWRIKLFNPLATLTPGRHAEDVQFDTATALVAAEEVIQHQGRTVKAFRVETAPVKMLVWVAPDGRVLRQEVEFPLLGRISVLEEPFDNDLRRQTLRLDGLR